MEGLHQALCIHRVVLNPDSPKPTYGEMLGAVMHSPASIGALGNCGVRAALMVLESNIRRIFLFQELLV